MAKTKKAASTTEELPTVTRCVSVPLGDCLGRVDSSRDPSALTPTEFWPPLHAAWRLSTQLANWSVQELLRHDCRRTPDMTRLPRFAGLNLYTRWNEIAPVAFRAAFDGCAGSAASIIRAVYQRWQTDRLAVLWKGEAAPASYRYPYPWPVRSQEWRLSQSEGVYRLSVTLPGGRHVYTLRVGAGMTSSNGRVFRGDFRRQEDQLAKILADPSQGGELRLCPRKQGDRVVGVMVRFAVTMPQPEKRTGEKVALIRTDPLRLLVVEVPGRSEPFNLNFDQLRGFVLRSEYLRNRLAEDTKYEKRWPSWKRRRFLKVGRVRADKQHDRLRTGIQQAVAAAVEFAARQGCGGVSYCDEVQTYIEPFRWYELRERMRQKCEEVGLSFHLVDAV